MRIALDRTLDSLWAKGQAAVDRANDAVQPRPPAGRPASIGCSVAARSCRRRVMLQVAGNVVSAAPELAVSHRNLLTLEAEFRFGA